jgi:hypothetical protein
LPEHTEFSRALLLAVDMWRYGARDGWQQAELQRALSDAVSAAAAAAGLDRASWAVQDSGDGFFARIEDGSAEPALVGRFVRELDARLEQFNRVRLPETRLRLRVSMHHGGSVPAAHGYASDGPVHVNRLLDAEQAREVLAALPTANLVQIVSSSIFEGCVSQRLTELSEGDFVRIRVEKPAKGFSSDAWIRVPAVPAAKVAELVGPGSLVLDLRLGADAGPDFVARVVEASFAAAGIPLPATVEEEGRDVRVSLPAGTPGERVLGVWLHHLGETLGPADPRIAVGVAFGGDPADARGLAARATRYLAGAEDSPVAVVVSGEVHHRFVAGSAARMVMPDSYRSLGTEPESWVRVLGYSVPPKPAPAREEVTARPVAPRIGVAHGPVSNFEGGIFHGPVVVGSWNDNRGAGR